jgi:CBS domain-containing protein
MKVSELHQQRLFTAEADETLDEAADRMRWHAIGALPVFDSHRLVGIITERDVTAAVADGADPATTPVADYMTRAPAVLGADSALAEAVSTMLELGVRTCRSWIAGVWSACYQCGICSAPAHRR